MRKLENNGIINTKVPFFKELVDVIDKEVFKNVDNDIQGIYNAWNDENLNSDVDSKSKSKPVVRNKELLRHENQKIPIDEVKLLGIDLPSWYGDYNSKNKIMIIGIDPMRGSKDFMDAYAEETNDILIGTPYAYHIKKVRSNQKNKNYTQFIDSLLNGNNFIYLTDIYKTFFYYTGIENKDIRSYKYYGQQQKLEKLDEENAIRKSILKTLSSEINLINPTIIITLGDISFTQLTCKSVKKNSKYAITPQFFSEEIFNDYKHIPIYPFMHLKARDANLLKFTSQYIPENDSKDFGNLFFEIVKKHELIK
jgi:hypothetical protein